MARQASAKVLKLITPVVEGLGYELVGTEYLPQGKHSVLRIYIDKPDSGVSVDDCEKVSRQVSSVLDVEDPIPGQYALEVSSPGLDRPLFTIEHFQRFVGYEVKLQFVAPIEGRRKMTAKILACENNTVSVEFEGERLEFPFGDIEKARLVPKFD